MSRTRLIADPNSRLVANLPRINGDHLVVSMAWHQAVLGAQLKIWSHSRGPKIVTVGHAEIRQVIAALTRIADVLDGGPEATKQFIGAEPAGG